MYRVGRLLGLEKGKGPLGLRPVLVCAPDPGIGPDCSFVEGTGGVSIVGGRRHRQ